MTALKILLRSASGSVGALGIRRLLGYTHSPYLLCLARNYRSLAAAAQSAPLGSCSTLLALLSPAQLQHTVMPGADGRRCCNNSPAWQRTFGAAIAAATLLLLPVVVFAFESLPVASLVPSYVATRSPFWLWAGAARCRHRRRHRQWPSTVNPTKALGLSHATQPDADPNGENEDDAAALQWQLFRQHHALGPWRGLWTTYDYMGDVLDETVAAVDLQYIEEDGTVTHAHEIAVGATRSDCATCFEALETRTLPVATYLPDTLLSRGLRLAACGMVGGPRVLRSGAMATELVLRYGDGRVRVTFQHAPVWLRDREAGSGPPDGLKVARVMLSREALRDAPPTSENEAADPPKPGDPIFHRPVSPFAWHKKWGGGTSWTWGPQSGDRGWQVEALSDDDQWHGNAPVELWNLRVPGGIFVQSPRVVSPGETALLRLAWLPDPDHLLRLEAGLVALQPSAFESDGDDVVALEPPRLVSLRCDVLRNMGDLEGQPVFLQQEQSEETAP